MKKIILVLFAVLVSRDLYLAQTTIFTEAPQSDGGTSSNRAPNGTSAHTYMRACVLVLQSELSSLPVNTVITSFGFTLNTGTNLNAVTGNFTLYIENTSDVSYSKSTTFTTAITTMTNVYASTMTVPNSSTSTSVTVTLATPFTYTGGGIYVAYDWVSSGPFDLTAAVYRCNYLGLTGGTNSGASSSSAPATLSSSNFRPCFLWGTANSYSNDVQVLGVEAPGRVNLNFNTPHVIKAGIKNSSNTALSNINVNLNVTGANSFANTQTITSLAPGAVTSVTFASFNPQIPGTNNISVSVAADQNTVNNTAAFTQSVTCDEWAQNPAAGSYTYGVGFAYGSGILATPFLNPVASSLRGIRASISNDPGSTGNNVYAALLSSSGAVVATTNTISISTLSSFITFTFSTPQNLSANTTYYLGLAQTANATTPYYPAGAVPTAYVPANLYYSTPLTGGTFVPITVNYGYFGIEALFTNTVGINATASATAICTGGSATLSATGVSSYTWNTGATSQNLVVTPATNTVYSVAGTTSIGCIVSTLVPIQVSPLPVTAMSSTNAVCLGNPVTFTAGGAVSYSWTNGGTPVTSSVFTDTPAITSTYVVTGSNNAGCTNTASIMITVNAFTSMNVPASTVICLGGSLTLNATGALSYTWNTGSATVNTSTVFGSPLASTVYSVSGTNNLGCIDSHTVDITVNSFTPGITGPSSVCLGQSANLTGTGAVSYSWDNGFSFSTLPVSPSVTTGYTLTAIGPNGCKGTASASVTVSANPTVMATAQRTVMCKGESNKLTASGASTYSWNVSSGATNTIVTITPTINLSLTYSVIGTNDAGCTSTAQVIVKVNACTGFIESGNAEVSVQIYPNPSSGLLTIYLENNSDASSVKIYNALGALIKSYGVEADQFQIDLKQEASGIYFVYVMRDDKPMNISKIIKN